MIKERESMYVVYAGWVTFRHQKSISYSSVKSKVQAPTTGLLTVCVMKIYILFHKYRLLSMTSNC